MRKVAKGDGKVSKKIMMLAFIFGISAFAHAGAEESKSKEENESKEEWTIGVAASRSTTPYKSYDKNNGVWPVVSYSNGKFFVRGNEAGVQVWKNGPHLVEVGVSYYDFEFNRKDTSHHQLKMLDKRKSTAMFDASYSYVSPAGIAKIKTSWDILDHSDGFLVDLSYRYPLAMEKDFKVFSGIGVEWANGNQHDYYYGVSSAESLRSGLSPYHAGSGFSTYLVIEAKYDITKKLSVFAVGRLNFLSDEIKDSPMTSKSTTTSIAGGVQYKF